MNFSMTIDYATVSTMAKDEYEMLRHIEACFLAAGYDSDTFAEYLAHYLELYHEMTVLPEKEYRNALEEARNEAYDEGFADAREDYSEQEDAPQGGEIEVQAEEEEGVETDPYYQGWQDAFNSRVDAQDPIMGNSEYRRGMVDGFYARGAARS